MHSASSSQPWTRYTPRRGHVYNNSASKNTTSSRSPAPPGEHQHHSKMTFIAGSELDQQNPDSLDRYRLELEDDLRKQQWQGRGGIMELGIHTQSPRPRPKGENTDLAFSNTMRRSQIGSTYGTSSNRHVPGALPVNPASPSMSNVQADLLAKKQQLYRLELERQIAEKKKKEKEQRRREIELEKQHLQASPEDGFKHNRGWNNRDRGYKISPLLTEGDIPAGRPYDSSKEAVYSNSEYGGGSQYHSPAPGPASARPLSPAGGGVEVDQQMVQNLYTYEEQYQQVQNASRPQSPRSRSPRSHSPKTSFAHQNQNRRTFDPFENRNTRDDFQVQMFAGPGKEFGPGLFAGLGVYSSPKRSQIVQKELQTELSRQIQEKRLRKELEKHREKQEQEQLDRKIVLEREEMVRKYEMEMRKGKNTQTSTGVEQGKPGNNNAFASSLSPMVATASGGPSASRKSKTSATTTPTKGPASKTSNTSTSSPTQHQHKTAASSTKKKKIDIDAEWAAWKKANNVQKTPDGTPPPSRGNTKVLHSPPSEADLYLRNEFNVVTDSDMRSESKPMGRDVNDQRPYDVSTEKRQLEYEKLRDEWENDYVNLRPPFVDTTVGPPKVSFFHHERFPDAYPKFGSALARDGQMQEEYHSMLQGTIASLREEEQAGGDRIINKGQLPTAPSSPFPVTNARHYSPLQSRAANQNNDPYSHLRLKTSDLVASRESQILRLHKANNESMQQELDGLKEQSKQQRVDIRVQMDGLKREAHNVQLQHQRALYEDFMGINTVLNSPVKEARALTTYELGLSGWNGPTMGESLRNELARPLDATSDFVPPKASVLDALYGPAERKKLLDDFLAVERENLYKNVLYDREVGAGPSGRRNFANEEEALLRTRDNWTALVGEEEEDEATRGATSQVPGQAQAISASAPAEIIAGAGEPDIITDQQHVYDAQQQQAVHDQEQEQPPLSPTLSVKSTVSKKSAYPQYPVSKITFYPGEVGYVPEKPATPPVEVDESTASKMPNEAPSGPKLPRVTLLEEEDEILRKDDWYEKMPRHDYPVPPKSPVMKITPPIFVTDLMNSLDLETSQKESSSNPAAIDTNRSNASSVNAEVLKAHATSVPGWFFQRKYREMEIRTLNNNQEDKEAVEMNEPQDDQTPGWFFQRNYREDDKEEQKLSPLPLGGADATTANDPEQQELDHDPQNLDALSPKSQLSQASQASSPLAVDTEKYDFVCIFGRDQSEAQTGGQMLDPTCQNWTQLKDLAKTADTIFISSDDTHYVRLRENVKWPLNRLAAGYPFSIGPFNIPAKEQEQYAFKLTEEQNLLLTKPGINLGGIEDKPREGEYMVSEALAKATWTGPCVANMAYPFAQPPEVYSNESGDDSIKYLYHACYNAEGLQLVVNAGDGSCGWQKGTPDDISVYLGFLKKG